MSEAKSVVFVLWQDESGIFVNADQYDRITRIEVALATAKTWGEFKKLMPPDELEELSHWWCNDGEYIFKENGSYFFIQPSEMAEFMSILGEDYTIDASDKFDSMKVPGVGDGDYPAMNYYTCDDAFPVEFVKKYGIGVGSPAAGAWTEYPLDKLEQMKTELAEYGISVSEDLTLDPLAFD